MTVFSGTATGFGGGAGVVVHAAKRSSAAAKRLMKKNLVTRRREDAKKSRFLLRVFASSRELRTRDSLDALHIRTQRLRHPHRPILILVILEDGHQRSPDRQAGAVQRVHVTALLLRRAIADVGASRLEVEEV